MGMMLSDALASHSVMQNKDVTVMALRDSFGIQSTHEPIRHSFGLDADAIVEALTVDKN